MTTNCTTLKLQWVFGTAIKHWVASVWSIPSGLLSTTSWWMDEKKRSFIFQVPRCELMFVIDHLFGRSVSTIWSDNVCCFIRYTSHVLMVRTAWSLMNLLMERNLCDLHLWPRWRLDQIKRQTSIVFSLAILAIQFQYHHFIRSASDWTQVGWRGRLCDWFKSCVRSVQ